KNSRWQWQPQESGRKQRRREVATALASRQFKSDLSLMRASVDFEMPAEVIDASVPNNASPASDLITPPRRGSRNRRRHLPRAVTRRSRQSQIADRPTRAVLPAAGMRSFHSREKSQMVSIL